MSPVTLGFIRGLGTVVLMAVLSYLANAANLNGVVGGSVAALIAAVALAVEHGMAASTGKALFGAVRTRQK